jgi:hypothetical protein
MPKYVIEREIPGVGRLSAAEMQAIARKSCEVLQALGPDIQWVESYVTDDKIYCVYIAADADIVREHARCGGFPANVISEVRAGIDPTTAEGAYGGPRPSALGQSVDEEPPRREGRPPAVPAGAEG